MLTSDFFYVKQKLALILELLLIILIFTNYMQVIVSSCPYQLLGCVSFHLFLLWMSRLIVEQTM